MPSNDDQIQRITRLTPLADLLARIDALVDPVVPREVDRAAVVSRVLAADVAVAPRPAGPIALQDGWAVASEPTIDASSYAPVPLPVAVRIGTGEPLPAGADAVAPFDAVTITAGRATICAPVGEGEGVLPAGGDVDARGPLLPVGRRLTLLDAAVLTAAGAPARLCVRIPRVCVVATRRDDTILDAASRWVAGAIAATGGEPRILAQAGLDALAAVLADDTADAVIGIGGTGSGPHDGAVRLLARCGRLEAHGIALAPGETTAFGMAAARPVLLLPGRVDATVAVWLAIGRRLLERLTGATEDDAGIRARLSRKISSRLGLTEWIPMRLHGDTAEPIASGYVSLAALAQADGWLLVPAESEGYPAGREVAIKAMIGLLP